MILTKPAVRQGSGITGKQRAIVLIPIHDRSFMRMTPGKSARNGMSVD